MYAEHARYVAWFASRLLGNRDDVDDVIQEVFLIAARRLPELRDPGAVKRWLATITVRRATRRLHRRRVMSWFGRAVELDAEELTAPDANPEDRALLMELFRRLEALPPRLRVAWTLRHIEEETLPTVAELCGCSLAEAKRRIAAAQKTLQKVLAHG